MALKRLDSFGHYLSTDCTKKGWSVNPWSGTVTATRGRDGRGGMSLFGGDRPLVTFAPQPIWYVGFAVNWTNTGQPGNFFEAYDGSTLQLALGYTASAQIQVKRGTTVIATSPDAVYNVNTWNHIQFGFRIDNTSPTPLGWYEVRLNGVTVPSLTATGVNTRMSANNQVTRLGFYGTISGGSNVTFSDVWMCDGNDTGDGWCGFMGDLAVDHRIVNANGSVRQFTPSTGTDDFAVVDDASPNTTDYLSSTTPGNEVTMGFPNASANSSVKGVQVCAEVFKTDAGVRTAATLLRVGTTNSPGDTTGIVASPGQFLVTPWGSKPDGTPWTKEDFDAAEAGLKDVA